MELATPPDSPETTSYDDAKRFVNAVRALADRSDLELDHIKAPKAVFEESRASINASINQALRDHHCARDSTETTKFREDIIRHSVRLNQLSEDYQAKLEEKKEDYQRRIQSTVKKLSQSLIVALGIDMVEKTAPKDLPKKDNTNKVDQPTPSVTEPESLVRTPATTTEQTVRAETGVSSTSKRPNDPEPEPPNKRRRPARFGAKETTIWFDEVYQTGRASTKHIIVEHPKDSGNWYIIRRCDECNRDFKDKPLVVAGSHLSSAKHGHQSRDAATVINKLGIAVLECSPTRAKKNNAVASRSFRAETKSGRSGNDAAATMNGHRHGRRGALGVAYPTPGGIYLGYWERAKKSWPVLLLPTENLDDFGVPETLETLRLLDKLPLCYRYDETSKTLEWEEGFEDGGMNVAQRQFPVMFFDNGLAFPSQSEVGWLAADNLESLDVDSTAASEVPHIVSVRAYLKERAPSGSNEGILGKGSLPNDADEDPDNLDEPPTAMEKDDTNTLESVIDHGADGNTAQIGGLGGLGFDEYDEFDEIVSPREMSKPETNPGSIWGAASPDLESEKAQTAGLDVESIATPNLGNTNPEPSTTANPLAGVSEKSPLLTQQSAAQDVGGSRSLDTYLATIAQESLHHNVRPLDPGRLRAEQQNSPQHLPSSRDSTREDFTPQDARGPVSGNGGDNASTNRGQPEQGVSMSPHQSHQNHKSAPPHGNYRPGHPTIPPMFVLPDPGTNTSSNPHHFSPQPGVHQAWTAIHSSTPGGTAHNVTWSGQYEGNPHSTSPGGLEHSAKWFSLRSDGPSHFRASQYELLRPNPPAGHAVGMTSPGSTMRVNETAGQHQQYRPMHNIPSTTASGSSS